MMINIKNNIKSQFYSLKRKEKDNKLNQIIIKIIIMMILVLNKNRINFILLGNLNFDEEFL